MSYKWSVLILNLLFSLEVFESANNSDIIQNSINGASFIANTTRLGLKKTVDAVVGAPFKPIEVIGTQLENVVIGGTSTGGKIINAIGEKVKAIAEKLQKQEEKFIKCVQSEQFDPVKVIILDEVKCVTSKFDTIHKIIHSTLEDVNITYTIIKDIPQLPMCGEDAKCLADYTSDLSSKYHRELPAIILSPTFTSTFRKADVENIVTSDGILYSCFHMNHLAKCTEDTILVEGNIQEQTHEQIAQFSSIIGKLGQITLGIGSILQSSVFGLASIPVSLPVCFVMKSTLNPAEVIGKLVFNILKCSV